MKQAHFGYSSRGMHDVFIVIGQGSGGEHIVRTVRAADHDDARQAHQANYADERILAVHQGTIPPHHSGGGTS